MQKKILEFTNILRKSGIRVSTAEAIDAFQALDELSIEDREVFRDALRTTMVKRGEEVATYDELFDLFWSGFYDNLREAFGPAAGGLEAFGLDLLHALDRHHAGRRHRCSTTTRRRRQRSTNYQGISEPCLAVGAQRS